MDTSGLPNLSHQKTMAEAAPATAERLVLTAITEMRRSVAPSVDPGLKPIQRTESRARLAHEAADRVHPDDRRNARDDASSWRFVEIAWLLHAT